MRLSPTTIGVHSRGAHASLFAREKSTLVIRGGTAERAPSSAACLRSVLSRSFPLTPRAAMPTTFSSTVVKTTLGPVRMRVAGAAANGTTLLALPGMGRSGNRDWERVITAGDLTTRANLRALLPDPLSNFSTAPSVTEFAIVRTFTTLFGSVKYPCREDWLLQTLTPRQESQSTVDEDDAGVVGGGGGGGVVLAGHSWGGGAAARFAVAHPDLVQKLILVSPDVEGSVARQLTVPTLLIWARDDAINPFFWTRRFRDHPSLTLHATDRGGHMVHESHADVIADWLNGGGGGAGVE